MGVETEADRLSLLDEDVFGTVVTYTPAGGGGSSSIKVIFDAASKAIDVGLEIQIASTGPQVIARTSDLSGGGRKGDTFVIDGVTYKATDVQPDGTGMTLIPLERQ